MQLYTNKTENPEEMEKFLEKYNILRVNQDEIEKMNVPITRLKLKQWFKKLQTNKSPGPDGFTGEFYQIFREELIPICVKWFQKNHWGRDTRKLILWGHHHPDTKTRQRHHKQRNLEASFTDEHWCKNPPQNTSKPNPTIH